MKYLICSLLSVGLSLAANPTAGQGVDLFNGRNLDGFYTFLPSQGVDQDPDHVFTVHDGMVHVSGAEYGYFATKGEYENYDLTVEFKWGDATHPPRAGKARDSGVLYHFVGPDKVWPKSIEFQMIEGGTGDIILVDGAAITRNGESKIKGRFDRYEKGPWKDVAGFRDPVREVEKPHGEWNTLELIADGDKVKYLVNGIVVNEGTGASPVKGKLLFQSEGAEVFFRNIRIRPLK